MGRQLFHKHIEIITVDGVLDVFCARHFGGFMVRPLNFIFMVEFFVRFVMWKRRTDFIQYYRWYRFTVDVLVLNIIILINVVVNMSLLKRRFQQRIWTSVCFMQFFRMSTKTIRTKALFHYITLKWKYYLLTLCGGCVQCTFALFQLNARSICIENWKYHFN